jgi:hypothetical protein
MQHFHDAAYRHAGDMTFMTFRVSETVLATGEVREQRGIESYTFRDGRLATKDVYRKPVTAWICNRSGALAAVCDRSDAIGELNAFPK